MANKKSFKKGDFVVYPAHGVGEINGVEKMQISDQEVELYSVTFSKDKLTLKLPKHRVEEAGLRNLLSHEDFDDAIETLKGKAKIKRIMWAKRAQEYKTKIESGCQVMVAEVLRDLSRNCSILPTAEDQSYSERKFYKYALDRFASEYSIVKNVSHSEAVEQIEQIIASKVKENGNSKDKEETAVA
ncbi:MAG: CarD family transcriptional regulator [Alphaproteobacteria bacterium]|nr:CarD family transcriptional regulator [Alphaproteobacteria bacterium]